MWRSVVRTFPTAGRDLMVDGVLATKFSSDRKPGAFVRSRSRSLVRWPTLHDACSTGGHPLAHEFTRNPTKVSLHRSRDHTPSEDRHAGRGRGAGIMMGRCDSFPCSA